VGDWWRVYRSFVIGGGSMGAIVRWDHIGAGETIGEAMQIARDYIRSLPPAFTERPVSAEVKTGSRVANL